jgi:hypothetical protein
MPAKGRASNLGAAFEGSRYYEADGGKRRSEIDLMKEKKVDY